MINNPIHLAIETTFIKIIPNDKCGLSLQVFWYQIFINKFWHNASLGYICFFSSYKVS